jgi:2-polyprenyl-3-methyl-5-hydroxy-6-metoxy-1,4-benzoquinol methylase
MRCAPGTHENAMGMLKESGVGTGPALDLASGSGAMVARLRENGFADITAVELDAKKFGVAGITPLAVDLNGDFAKVLGRRFSVVTAIEIIEHLDSPRHFLTQVRELLDENGMLLLTTPNIAEWMGRIRFLLTGTLRYFDDGQYDYNHHVSPLPAAQMRHLLAEVGLEIAASKTAGTFFGPLKMACMLPLWLPFRLFGGPTAMGDVNLYVLRRTSPKSSRASDWTADAG